MVVGDDEGTRCVVSSSAAADERTI